MASKPLTVSLATQATTAEAITDLSNRRSPKQPDIEATSPCRHFALPRSCLHIVLPRSADTRRHHERLVTVLSRQRDHQKQPIRKRPRQRPWELMRPEKRIAAVYRVTGSHFTLRIRQARSRMPRRGFTPVAGEMYPVAGHDWRSPYPLRQERGKSSMWIGIS